MNLKVIILSLCMALSVLAVRAESKFTPSKNKHDFRMSFSDGIPCHHHCEHRIPVPNQRICFYSII